MKLKSIGEFRLNVKMLQIPLDWRRERFFSIRLSFVERMKLLFIILTKKYPKFLIKLDDLRP
jgi:hypothetical protein